MKALFSHVSTLRESTQRMLPYWVAASITALVSVLFANAFRWSEELSMSVLSAHPASAFLLTPLAMLASMELARRFSPLTAGSGIPQMLAAVEAGRKDGNPLVEKILSVKAVVVKLVGTCVCVAGGGVTGREGPMLQISGGIFHVVHRLWSKAKRKPDLQSMILAGGAAGLASAFNTPLGGIIFAIEELAKTHVSSIRTYVFHSVIIAGVLAQALMGNYLYLAKMEVVSGSAIEFLPMVVASALIGIFGAIFGKAVVWILELRGRLKPSSAFLLTVACGWIVALIFYFYGTSAIGSGRAVIVDLLTGDGTAPASLGFVRAFANYFTYSGGVIGGIFAPALSAGAGFGSWMSSAVPEFHHRVWAMMGMVAFLTGVSRTPFTSMILVLEMTDTSHTAVLNLMIAAIIAQSAAKLVDPTGFYEQVSHRLLRLSESDERKTEGSAATAPA